MPRTQVQQHLDLQAPFSELYKYFLPVFAGPNTYTIYVPRDQKEAQL